MRLPARECEHLSATIFSTPLVSNAMQAAAHLHALEAHRARTIEALRCIEDRDEVVSMVEGLLLKERGGGSRDLIKSIPELRKRTTAVIESISLWREGLWRPLPFVMEGGNYLDKMMRDAERMLQLEWLTCLPPAEGMERREGHVYVFLQAERPDRLLEKRTLERLQSCEALVQNEGEIQSQLSTQAALLAKSGFTVPTLKPVDGDGATMTPQRMRELFSGRDVVTDSNGDGSSILSESYRGAMSPMSQGAYESSPMEHSELRGLHLDSSAGHASSKELELDMDRANISRVPFLPDGSRGGNSGRWSSHAERAQTLTSSKQEEMAHESLKSYSTVREGASGNQSGTPVKRLDLSLIGSRKKNAIKGSLFRFDPNRVKNTVGQSSLFNNRGGLTLNLSKAVTDQEKLMGSSIPPAGSDCDDDLSNYDDLSEESDAGSSREEPKIVKQEVTQRSKRIADQFQRPVPPLDLGMLPLEDSTEESSYQESGSQLSGHAEEVAGFSHYNNGSRST